MAWRVYSTFTRVSYRVLIHRFDQTVGSLQQLMHAMVLEDHGLTSADCWMYALCSGEVDLYTSIRVCWSNLL
jgi:hypothetical protein